MNRVEAESEMQALEDDILKAVQKRAISKNRGAPSPIVATNRKLDPIFLYNSKESEPAAAQ